MNIILNSQEFKWVKEYVLKEITVGSHLYKTNTEDSDKDCIVVVGESFEYSRFPCHIYAPYIYNHHFFFYRDEDSKKDYIITTYKSLIRNTLEGDFIIFAEYLLLEDERVLEEVWNFSYDLKSKLRSYKVIKAFLGFAKRDIKAGRLWHGARCLYFAECLIKDIKSEVDYLAELKHSVESRIKKGEDVRGELLHKENKLRATLNKMLDSQEIEWYNLGNYKEDKGLSSIDIKYLDALNTREFKYFL